MIGSYQYYVIYKYLKVDGVEYKMTQILKNSSRLHKVKHCDIYKRYTLALDVYNNYLKLIKLFSKDQKL